MNTLKNILYSSILLIVFFLSNLNVWAQEEKEFKPRIVREIGSDNRFISYVEIVDSALAFIYTLKEKWGDEEDVNGKIIWNNVTIDSIEGKIKVELYHAIVKKGEGFNKTYPINKKEKANEIRIIRLRFMQKDKDLLASRQLSEYIMNFVLQVYDEIKKDDEKEEEEEEEE